MTQFLSGLSVVLLGAIGWFALEFVGRPIRSFFDLRRETRRQMFFLANVPPVKFVDDHIRAAEPEHQRSIAAIRNVEKTFRDLGTQLIAFGESEWPASRLIKLAGFDAIAAGRALIGFSNNANAYGAEKADFRMRVGEALRFKD
jgi:hypothetical protein